MLKFVGTDENGNEVFERQITSIEGVRIIAPAEGELTGPHVVELYDCQGVYHTETVNTPEEAEELVDQAVDALGED